MIYVLFFNHNGFNCPTCGKGDVMINYKSGSGINFNTLWFVSHVPNQVVLLLAFSEGHTSVLTFSRDKGRILADKTGMNAKEP